MEEILNNLQAIKEFRALARTSTSQYHDLNRPTFPEIANKLAVSYIVEDSGHKNGNTFTLKVQLIRAKGKETHIWGNTYNDEIKEGEMNILSTGLTHRTQQHSKEPMIYTMKL